MNVSPSRICEANGRISLVPTSPAQSLEKSYLILWLPGTSQTSSRPMLGPCRTVMTQPGSWCHVTLHQILYCHVLSVAVACTDTTDQSSAPSIARL